MRRRLCSSASSAPPLARPASAWLGVRAAVVPATSASTRWRSAPALAQHPPLVPRASRAAYWFPPTTEACKK